MIVVNYVRDVIVFIMKYVERAIIYSEKSFEDLV